MEAVIIGNGDFPRKAYPRELIRRAGIIVCCDRGLEAFLRNRGRIFGQAREPDLVIGDIDSLPKGLAEKYAGILVREEEQDDNDQTKAVRYILSRYPEVDAIHIMGATGKRECHTVGNLSLLMEYAREYGISGNPADGGIFMDMISDYCTSFAITDSCELFVGEGRPVSIFSPDNSLTIKSEGLAWPTDEVIFDNWWKATLNKASSDCIKLKFSHPSMALVILD